MSAVRIKKGDTVKVIAGKDKGKTGKVMSGFLLYHNTTPFSNINSNSKLLKLFSSADNFN